MEKEENNKKRQIETIFAEGSEDNGAEDVKIERLQKSIEKMLGEFQNIKSEISEIKQQTTTINERLTELDITNLTYDVQKLMHFDPTAKINDTIKSIFAENATTLLSKDAFSKAKETPHKKIVKFISNALFYFCMAILILGAISFAQNQDPEKSIFGYRYYYIKTSSMEPVLPVGSVVFTKDTPPENIRIGDDITVYLGDDKTQTYLTHRVVEIIEDEVTGDLLFRTKGVNNKQNDATPFNSKLVVGKVVLCVPVLGTIMLFVQSQLIFVIVIFILMLALSFMLRILFTKEKPQENPNKVIKKELNKNDENKEVEEVNKEITPEISEENEKTEKETTLEENKEKKLQESKEADKKTL